MSCKKLFFSVVLILFVTSLLSAQVNFQYVCSLNKPNSGINYHVSQLFDYDNNDIDEIITQFYDEDQYVQNIIITDLYGTIIDSILIDDWVILEEYTVNDKAALIKDNTENLLLRAQIPFPYVKLRLSLQDCETLAYIDSSCAFPQYYDWIYEINTIDKITCDDQIMYCVGANELSPSDKEDSNKSILYLFQMEDDTLHFKDSVIECGLSISTPYNTILTVGKYFYAEVGLWPQGYRRFYLNRVHLNSDIFTEQLNTVNGSVEWTDTLSIYYHYPSNYRVVTSNNLDDAPQVLQYRKIDTDNGNSVHFKAYDTTDWQELWSKTDTEIGLGNIIASTCIQVNDEDHYVMYFRGSKLEIRDRITGNIIHHQDSVLAVCDILRKSDGELLFFVEKDDETGYDVYSLDGPIFVSNDEPPVQNDIIIEQYPNPFRSSTTFSFSSKEPIQNAEIKIYNVKGQLVRKLRFCASSLPRFLEVTWDGKDENHKNVAEGIYLYKIKTDKQEFVGKIVKVE